MADMHIYIVVRQLLLLDRTFRKADPIDAKHCLVRSAIKDYKFSVAKFISQAIKGIINKNKNCVV